MSQHIIIFLWTTLVVLVSGPGGAIGRFDPDIWHAGSL